MHHFPLAHAHGGDTDHLVAACLEQLGTPPATANLGFVYATDALAPDLENLMHGLRRQTGVPHWTGTVGVGIAATGREYYDEPALAIMLGSFPPDSFHSLPLQQAVGQVLPDTTAAWLQRDEFHLGVLHCDPTHAETPRLVESLSERIPGAFFVGGLTSSHGANPQIADAVTRGGASGVLFSSDVPVASGHTQGCSPIGGKHRITSCQHNVLIELDGRPAFDVFREDIGEVMAQDLQRIAGYIFAGIPIRGSDTGDYMVRNLMGVDTDQGLVAIGDIVEPGGEVMFCRRDGNSAREDMLRMLADIRGRMGDRPRGALYYSCLGRGRYQFGDNSEELGFIRDELGDIPLVGFFANGEIFHNRLYGYTGVLTIFC